MVRIWAMGLIAVLFCTAGCGVVQGTPLQQTGQLSGKLTMTGSTAMTELCQCLGEAFMERYPGVQVEKSGVGSGAAAEAVRSGQALLGDVSRPLLESEHPEEFSVTVLANDVLVILVSAENPIETLTTEEVRKILTGEITNWAEVGGLAEPITCIGREAASGTRMELESTLGIVQGSYDCEYSSSGEVVTRVGSDPTAIGYASITALRESVKAVAINGIAPSLEHAAEGSYLLVQPLFQILRKGEENPLVTAWLAFVRSPEGQSVVQACGYGGVVS